MYLLIQQADFLVALIPDYIWQQMVKLTFWHTS